MFFVIFILSNVVVSIVVDNSTKSVQIGFEHSILELPVFAHSSADSHQIFGSFFEEAALDEIAIDDISFELKLGGVEVKLVEGAVVKNLADCESIEVLPFGDCGGRDFFWLRVENVLQLVAV